MAIRPVSWVDWPLGAGLSLVHGHALPRGLLAAKRLEACLEGMLAHGVGLVLVRDRG